jgi:hypothetical protein
VTTFHATVRFDLDCDGMSEVTTRFEGPFDFPTTASPTRSTTASLRGTASRCLATSVRRDPGDDPQRSLRVADPRTTRFCFPSLSCATQWTD